MTRAKISLSDFCHENGWDKPRATSNQPKFEGFSGWKMEEGDAPIMSHLFNQHRPLRHLEFGTWQGFGTKLCLEACEATVWTINLWEGETRKEGGWQYGEKQSPDDPILEGAVVEDFVVLNPEGQQTDRYIRTDAASMIGHLYREAGLGNRVCQIYSDSVLWDTRAYPEGFFDSVFIDGGHTPEVVANDTLKSLPLLRSGGLMLWHDYCEDQKILNSIEACNGVFTAIESMTSSLSEAFTRLYWIYPSFLLAGVKK